MTFNARNLMVDLVISIGLSMLAAVYKMGVFSDGTDIIAIATLVTTLKVFYDVVVDLSDRRRRNNKKRD